jgi:hypothetical protein
MGNKGGGHGRAKSGVAGGNDEAKEVSVGKKDLV